MNNKVCILNTNIIMKDCILENHSIIIEDDRIDKIIAMDLLRDVEPNYIEMNIHEGKDSYISPGFIDVHSDNIESVIQPRPTSIIDFGIALMEHEKQLVNQGITTMYHSLSFLRKNGAAMRDKEARRPEKMRELAELIKNLHESFAFF